MNTVKRKNNYAYFSYCLNKIFGIHTVKQLLANGHKATIATRGSHGNPFGTQVSHILMDRSDEDSVWNAVQNREFDAVIDKVAYASNDVRSLLKHLRCGRYIQRLWLRISTNGKPEIFLHI
jgi:hypothetical protein